MVMLRKAVTVGLLWLAILSAPISVARAADVSVTLTVFHDRLAPYGEWVSVGRYGSCWRPRRVDRTWRPYTVGHWVYSDYGWTWVSDESWGWATYHYGRWVDDPDYGWIWVPDETWGPAYVSWRYGGDWIGWAPLPPGISLGVAVDIDRYVRPSAYAFVQARYFPDPQMRTHIVADARNGSLIPVTRNVTRYESAGGRVVDHGVDPRAVERASGHRITQLRVRDTSDPHAARARVANNELTVYRPSTTSREAGRPSAQNRAPSPPHAQAARGEPPKARATTGRVVPQPSRAEQAPRRSTQAAPRQRPTQPPRAQRYAQTPHAPQTGQRAAPSTHTAPQRQAPAQERRARPQVNQRAPAAARQQPTSRQQPRPVATGGHSASKRVAAPKGSQKPKTNGPPQKDEPQKDKKKGEEP